MMKENNIFLKHILENIVLIEQNISEADFNNFIKNKTIQDAIVREIEIIGEATKNVSENLKNKHPEIPWRKISGMRDKIVHEYFDIDLEVIWKTVQNDLPIFKKQIEDLLKEL